MQYYTHNGALFRSRFPSTINESFVSAKRVAEADTNGQNDPERYIDIICDIENIVD